MVKSQVVKIEVDDEEILTIILDQIKEKLLDFEPSQLFYTMDDLQKITGFSKGHVKNTFFDDERFIKIRRKTGRKWSFPVKETREFLNEWLKEQPNE